MSDKRETRFPVKPTDKKPDIKEMARRCYERWPLTMARLAE